MLAVFFNSSLSFAGTFFGVRNTQGSSKGGFIGVKDAKRQGYSEMPGGN